MGRDSRLLHTSLLWPRDGRIVLGEPFVVMVQFQVTESFKPASSGLELEWVSRERAQWANGKSRYDVKKKKHTEKKTIWAPHVQDLFLRDPVYQRVQHVLPDVRMNLPKLSHAGEIVPGEYLIPAAWVVSDAGPTLRGQIQGMKFEVTNKLKSIFHTEGVFSRKSESSLDVEVVGAVNAGHSTDAALKKCSDTSRIMGCFSGKHITLDVQFPTEVHMNVPIPLQVAVRGPNAELVQKLRVRLHQLVALGIRQNATQPQVRRFLKTGQQGHALARPGESVEVTLPSISTNNFPSYRGCLIEIAYCLEVTGVCSGRGNVYRRQQVVVKHSGPTGHAQSNIVEGVPVAMTAPAGPSHPPTMKQMSTNPSAPVPSAYGYAPPPGSGSAAYGHSNGPSSYPNPAAPTGPPSYGPPGSAYKPHMEMNHPAHVSPAAGAYPPRDYTEDPKAAMRSGKSYNEGPSNAPPMPAPPMTSMSIPLAPPQSSPQVPPYTSQAYGAAAAPSRSPPPYPPPTYE